MQGIDCQWNHPRPRFPPACSQSQQAVPLPPSPVTVRILEKPELLLDTAECLSKAHTHSMMDSLSMKPSSSTFSSSLLSISSGCASFSFSYQGQDSRKAWNSLDTAECLSKAHKHSMQGIGCQWNCPLPHVPPPCSQSQQAPSPVRVRILENLKFFRYCWMSF